MIDQQYGVNPSTKTWDYILKVDFSPIRKSFEDIFKQRNLRKPRIALWSFNSNARSRKSTEDLIRRSVEKILDRVRIEGPVSHQLCAI